MKKTNNFKKMLMWVVLLLPLLLCFQSEEAQATHFRYGHLTWQRLSPTGNDVRFTLTCAFRRGGFDGTAGDGSLAVGDIFEEEIGSTNLEFGDGNNTGVLNFKVISVDVANDWVLSLALEPGSITKTTVDHIYPSSTNGGSPWKAEINTCCRTSFEENNPDGQYQVSTFVELASGNRSPVSSLPAIVNVMQSANSQFLVPAADADPNTQLFWRLATSDEAGDGFDQPFGLTINSSTGLVSWNSLFAVVGGLYSCQVIIEDRNSITGGYKTQVAVDFLIQVTPVVSPCDQNVAPVFVQVSPVCGSTLLVNEGQPISFTMTASDPDAGNVVSLNSGGGPTGSSFTPGLPATGNPVSTTFNWTPGAGTAGAYVVTFTATDSCGAQSLCSVTIQVNANPCHLNIGCRHVQPTCNSSCDGSSTANVTGGSGQYGYLWSNGQTTRTATGLCSASYTVTVTDLVTQCTKSKVMTLNKAKVTIKTTLYKACGQLCNGAITALGGGGNGAPYTYLWSNGATTATITGICPNVNYTITVTDKLGCTATCVRKVARLNNCPSRLSENDDDSKQIAAYPNPFNSKLNIDVATDEDLTIKVQDIAGRVINVYQNIDQSFVMDASLNNGIYFLNIENESGSFKQVIKVIKAN